MPYFVPEKEFAGECTWVSGELYHRGQFPSSAVIDTSSVDAPAAWLVLESYEESLCLPPAIASSCRRAVIINQRRLARESGAGAADLLILNTMLERLPSVPPIISRVGARKGIDISATCSTRLGRGLPRSGLTSVRGPRRVGWGHCRLPRLSCVCVECRLHRRSPLLGSVDIDQAGWVRSSAVWLATPSRRCDAVRQDPGVFQLDKANSLVGSRGHGGDRGWESERRYLACPTSEENVFELLKAMGEAQYSVQCTVGNPCLFWV